VHTVLVIDDNALNVELVVGVLEVEGFEVLTATDGRKGVACALAQKPDVVLMDLRMPGMSGMEAMRELRDDPETRDIPVVVLTASAMKGDREQLLEIGFDGYLGKPIDPVTFADEVCAFCTGASQA